MWQSDHWQFTQSLFWKPTLDLDSLFLFHSTTELVGLTWTAKCFMNFPIILQRPLLPLWSKVICLRKRHHLPYPVAASDSAELSQWLHFSTFSLNLQRLRGIQTFLAYTPLMRATLTLTRPKLKLLISEDAVARAGFNKKTHPHTREEQIFQSPSAYGLILDFQ